MSSDDGMRGVGTIRSIELHTLAAKFQNVTTRQVAKIQLDIERATDEEGEELDVVNLADLSFQGPAALVLCGPGGSGSRVSGVSPIRVPSTQITVRAVAVMLK